MDAMTERKHEYVRALEEDGEWRQRCACGMTPSDAQQCPGPPKPAFKPKSYTDAEEAFDAFYKTASDEFELRKKDSYGTKGFDHRCYEAVMDLLGPGVWKELP